jgi:hypothetical protein
MDAANNPMTVTVNGREYRILEVCGVGPAVRANGCHTQCVVRGKRGATYLYQVWDDGEKRLINGGVCYRELPRRAAIA